MIELPVTLETAQGLSVAPSGAAELSVLLDVFFEELSKLQLPIAQHLAPGLTDTDVRELLATKSLSAPDELVAWYSRFNGLRFEPGEEPFNCFPRFPLHSLEQAIALYERDSTSPGLGTQEWEWHPQWLRIGGSVQSIAVKCGDDTDEPVLVRSVGDDRTTQEPRPTYQVVSLCTPITWWIEGLREGHYAWNGDTRRWQSNVPQSIDQGRSRSGLV